jgi:hypothetical protein
MTAHVTITPHRHGDLIRTVCTPCHLNTPHHLWTTATEAGLTHNRTHHGWPT